MIFYLFAVLGLACSCGCVAFAFAVLLGWRGELCVAAFVVAFILSGLLAGWLLGGLKEFVDENPEDV